MGSRDFKSGLLAIMLCELCRVLENSFPGVAKKQWDLNSILGDAVNSVTHKLPIGRLSAALQNSATRASTHSMREMLSSQCQEQFCFFIKPDVQGNTQEIGLLFDTHDEHFLMINFTQRWFQLIGRSLMFMQNNRSDRKKRDLIIKRDDDKDEFFRLDAAPKDVSLFWHEYME
ncbi:hypothetical protein QBC35DRAFT_508601 [Podospora australis]|uniref:Uncharacterized protein n=1 Tax=Podospora australis TaxID=1536484 RepID=A0AAN7AEP0_9PEZI|nr:hypothetical protein QBC35DRAFT_508601 [Podospora australis]